MHSWAVVGPRDGQRQTQRCCIGESRDAAAADPKWRQRRFQSGGSRCRGGGSRMAAALDPEWRQRRIQRGGSAGSRMAAAVHPEWRQRQCIQRGGSGRSYRVVTASMLSCQPSTRQTKAAMNQRQSLHIAARRHECVGHVPPLCRTTALTTRRRSAERLRRPLAAVPAARA